MNIYDFTVKDTNQAQVSLEDYKGKVLLIVNTASKCGFTPQYEELESLYKQLSNKGFEILDFPCNQFLEQAPGTNDELASFCKLNYGTSFKTFGKIDVNGESADPLYQYLREEAPEDIDNNQMDGLREKVKSLGFTPRTGNEIQWNFTKFLVDKDGNVVARYAPSIPPKEIKAKIEELLG